MKINQENRNYYNCREFGYLIRNYRNKRTGDKIEEGRKLEYKVNENNKEKEINRQNNN